jgi:hypothetical protein
MGAILAWNNRLNGATVATAAAIAGMDSVVEDATRTLERASGDRRQSYFGAVAFDAGAGGGTFRVRFAGATLWTTRVAALFGVKLASGAKVSSKITAASCDLLTGSTGAPVIVATVAIAAPVTPTWQPSVPFLFPFAQDYSVDGFQVTFTVAANAVDTLHIGRAWMSAAMMFADGVDSQWSQGEVDRSKLHMSRGESPHEQSGARVRTLGCALTQLPELDAYGDTGDTLSIAQLKHEVGTSGEVVLTPRDSTELYKAKLCLLGRFERELEIEHDTGPYYKTALAVKETL